MPSTQLDAYFKRIQWGGEVRQDLGTLASLVLAHMAHIPFENLDVLLGRPIHIDVDSVLQKLVHAGRGGYCFEHATLFAAVLNQVGFAPERKLARVTLKAPRDAVPRTHMFLVVPLAEGRFVVDVGFGALAPPYPVALSDVQPPGSAGLAHWMKRDKQHWTLCAAAKGKDIEAWSSTLEDEGPADFEMGNHYVATHPQSAFVNRILLRAMTPDGRVTVMNRDVTIWRADQAEPLHLADRSALRTLLVKHFGFDLPQLDQLRVPSIPEWA